jgi:L-rhamnose-H+ transport protein
VTANPVLGVFLHALGGLAAGSFYIPFKGVRKWAWESYWLVGGVFSWVLAPWIVAFLTVPDPIGVLRAAPVSAVGWAYAYGILWGIGGLTFGLSMRYLGMSLGYALALGFCAAFGTIIPPMYFGEFAGLVSSGSGLVTLGGVAVCLAGIAVCGRAGILKERDLSEEAKKSVISEFNFRKGVWVAAFCGVMSACMAFGIAAGKPIAAEAVKRGTADLWQNSPVFCVIFAGGFTTNLIWCLYLNWKNKTGGDYLAIARDPRMWVMNLVLSAAAGVTWYFQFMFYGMGTTQMGKYDFSSWTIHMAFIIVFSNLWGLYFREWRGTSRLTHYLVRTGITVLVLSTVVVGCGNYLANLEKKAQEWEAVWEPAQEHLAAQGLERQLEQPERAQILSDMPSAEIKAMLEKCVEFRCEVFTGSGDSLSISRLQFSNAEQAQAVKSAWDKHMDTASDQTKGEFALFEDRRTEGSVFVIHGNVAVQVNAVHGIVHNVSVPR